MGIFDLCFWSVASDRTLTTPGFHHPPRWLTLPSFFFFKPKGTSFFILSSRESQTQKGKNHFTPSPSLSPFSL